MAVAAHDDSNSSTVATMNANPSTPGKPDTTPQDERAARPVQTGALSGGQPGVGVNTSSSEAGQQNADAAEAEGVEYGEKKRDRH